MNYIYDIFLNFNYNIYDFYEWNKGDNIIHIKKIPLFKISEQMMIDIINNNIIIDESFLDKIINKTETFNNTIKYACLLASNKYVIGINIDKSITYSSLLIEEEDEVLEYIKFLDEESIDYKIISFKNKQCLTRKEIFMRKYIRNNIKKLISNKEYNKLKYIYLECFCINADIDYIIDNILIELDNNKETYGKVYNLFKFYLIR